jgi:hypothetical protein
MDNDGENSEKSEEQSEERGFGEVAERELPEDDDEGSKDEQIDEESDDIKENESEQPDDQERKEGDKGDQKDESQESKQKLTEKGTKLDPDPKSAVHQQLANQTRIRDQMERVLADPVKIARFVKEQYGIDMPTSRKAEGDQGDSKDKQTEVPTTKKWTAKDFESLEDVADKFNQLQEGFSKQLSEKDAKIEKLNKQVAGVLEGGRLGQIADQTESDVRFLRSVPELNPKSPDFIEGLEGKISRQYRKLDFDEKTGQFKGQYSIKEIAEDILDVARDARKSGSKRAQTIVKDKTGGIVKTSPAVDDKADRDTLPPAQSIAAGVAKMFK